MVFLYAVIGFIVMATGTQWIEKLMPPVVTGAVVMIIGLNLAPITVSGVQGKPFDLWMALMTVLCMGMIAVFCTWIFTAFVTTDRFGDGICNLCDSDQYFGFR